MTPRNTLLINILGTLCLSFITNYYTYHIQGDIFVINLFLTTYVAIVLCYLFSNIEQKSSYIIVLSFFLNLLLISSYLYSSFFENKETSIAEIINNKLLITILLFQDLCQINYNLLFLVLSIIFLIKLKAARIIRIFLIFLFIIAGFSITISTIESNYHFLYTSILSFYLYYYLNKVKTENLISNISKDKYIITKLIFAVAATNIIFLSFSKDVYMNNNKTLISDQKTKIINNKHIIIPVRTEDISSLNAEPFMHLNATDPTEDALLKKAFEKSLIKHNIQHRFTVITPSEIPNGRFKPTCSLYYLENKKDTATVFIFIDKNRPDIIFDITNPLANSVYNLRYMKENHPLPPIDEVSDLSIEWLGYIYNKYSDNIYNDVNKKFSKRLLEIDNNYIRRDCPWIFTNNEYYFQINL